MSLAQRAEVSYDIFYVSWKNEHVIKAESILCSHLVTKHIIHSVCVL